MADYDFETLVADAQAEYLRALQADDAAAIAATAYNLAVAQINRWDAENPDETYLELSGANLDRLPPIPSRVVSLSLNHATVRGWVFPDHIRRLSFYNATLDNPAWPSTLQGLRVHNTDAVDLKDVPSTLTSLRLDSITSPVTLSVPCLAGLQHLHIDRCPWLVKLPSLPASLATLYVRSCGLKTLPRAFPPGILCVDLDRNHIRRLPVFPATLHYLSAEGNPLLLQQDYSDALGSPKEDAGLCAYLRDLYRLQEHPEEIPFDNDIGLSPDEVADPHGDEAWD